MGNGICHAKICMSNNANKPVDPKLIDGNRFLSRNEAKVSR